MEYCKICGNIKGNLIFIAREMLQGTRNEFNYLECISCGCVQIIEVPGDLSGYYSNSSYGSFSSSKRSNFKAELRKIRNKYAICNKGGAIGKLLNKISPLPYDYCAIKDYATLNAKILDVGCGIGAYIYDLSNIGFVNATGIDPFIDEDFVYPNGVVIRKKFVGQLTEQYDVILSHHSFEHVPNPLETLKSIKDRLNMDGVCILTIPVAEDLYKIYKENCYLIQAPQHFFLYSIKSMSILAQKSGFKIEKIVRDASNTLDWCKISELWKNDVACNEENENNKRFSREELNKVLSIEKEVNCFRCG